MKRVLTAIFILTAITGGWAQPLTRPAWIDQFGQPAALSASSPLPVAATVDVGTLSADVTETPYVTASVAESNSTPVSASVTPLVDRKFIQIVNVGTTTVWLAVNSGVATVSKGVPILGGQYFSERWGDAVPISYISSITCPIVIWQGK